MNFREIIQQTMAELGVSAYQLSKETGVGEARLSRFFKGDGSNGLSIPALLRLLSYLQLELRIVKNRVLSGAPRGESRFETRQPARSRTRRH